ncbi:MAG: 4-hydroxy-tetrahydrodipicolinate reductase [Clostridia bacterium]|nr:4-hydroxy-tetrahydrodipicolinate reductase [Clostridia bacterium]
MKVILTGAGGYMGKVVTDLAKAEGVEIIAGVDLRPFEAPYPIYASIADVPEKPDVVIDFSHPSALPSLLAYSRITKVPVIFCTTGYSADELNEIKKLSETMPVFRSGNMSLGINLLEALVKKAAAVLKGFDVEILEMHHHRKIDAPSGTAKMLLEAVQSVEPDRYPVYDRHAEKHARDPREVGMHALRGGTVVGEHQVYFAGENEVVTLSHSAEKRDVFAVGALRAASFMAGVTKPGLYTMQDVIGNMI